MKYAIYDKAADGYLTKLEFENDVPVQTLGLICGYNEYITEAKLLDTKGEAVAVVTRIESNKFMEKGRFVIHSFDEKLADQYIISETGNPTKVVDSITVDLDGNINVKYGTMLTHWSTKFLEYAINRMNALQKAKSPKYTSWCNTFDIYKVITVIDERSCTHYQFINVTTKGLEEYAKNEVDPLNKRIEELEKANYKINKSFAEQAVVCTELRVKNTNLTNKVESIKKGARDWKNMYESVVEHREVLKNVIDTIYTDLKSASAYCDKSYRLKAALNAFKRDDILNHISMPTEVYYIQENGVCLTAKDEVCAIIDQILTIIESSELNKNSCVCATGEVPKAIANDIIDICEADDEFDITLKKFTELYEAIWVPGTSDDAITRAFKSVLEIFTALEDKVRKIIDESVEWKFKAQTAEKALLDQNKLNDANKATIAQMVVEKHTMNKEIKELRDTRGSIAEVMFAIRNAICNNNSGAFDCILNRMMHDSDFSSSPFMAGVRENIKDICAAEKKNIANHDLKNGEIARLSEERDKAIERAEFYKRQANSIYGMTVPTRCCGKLVMADILSGKKIPVDKKKYDDLVEYVSNINLTYDNIFCMMDKPVYLSTITESLNDLTK